MSIAEKKVLEHLTNTGAATKLELKEATGHGKDHVQAAVTKLVAQGRVHATAARKKHNSNRNHVVYAALKVVPQPVVEKPKVASVNVFEHPEIYTRLNGLESKIGRLNHTIEDLQKNIAILLQREGAHNARLNKTIKYVNDFDLDRIRLDGVLMEQGSRINGFVGRMDGFSARLIALETPQPAVDPIYVEIEQDLTDKLGGQVSPNLLRTFIEEAYAERVK